MTREPRAIDLTSATPDEHLHFIGKLLTLLNRSPFRLRKDWAKAVIVFAFGEHRCTSRADFAQWLRANDMMVTANECTSRRVPPAHVMVWLASDNAKGTCAGFALVNLKTELARATAASSRAAA